MKNLIKISTHTCMKSWKGMGRLWRRRRPAMTTVAHPQLSTNCPNMFGFVVVVVVALHWLETKWNEKTQLGQNMVHGVGGRVATQCNDERKIDMHVISRIRTSTRIADVDDVVCSPSPSTSLLHISIMPFMCRLLLSLSRSS